MMENFPNFLSTSSSSSSLSFHQMLFSRASELVGSHGGDHYRQPPPVSGGFPLSRDVLGDDMSFDASSSMKDDDVIVSLSKSFRVDESARIGVDGLEKKEVATAGATTTTGTGRGDHDKKKKMRSRRFAFQTRSQVDILDDGYRWRKYGQKAVKNNKFPRSYYRCTHQGCKVKKQVQRLTRDEGVVVTTYEGIHSHPIEKSTDNFEHILSQMQIYTSY
ncbi:probable WRKY transcription factor 50 [Benincasa hispida]|uniref:probable WRKY transcription factor 50 n=1 Tax=Benincasa hispida TaxID=102211 RepID=UPI0019024B79|nr:probable WRKY transcription factor 50 [Benincasa hispida]